MVGFRFPSKAWSCGSLVAGSAAVVDTMAAPAADVIAAQRQAMHNVADLTEEEIEKLLQDIDQDKLERVHICSHVLP